MEGREAVKESFAPSASHGSASVRVSVLRSTPDTLHTDPENIVTRCLDCRCFILALQKGVTFKTGKDSDAIDPNLIQTARKEHLSFECYLERHLPDNTIFQPSSWDSPSCTWHERKFARYCEGPTRSSASQHRLRDIGSGGRCQCDQREYEDEVQTTRRS